MASFFSQIMLHKQEEVRVHQQQRSRSFLEAMIAQEPASRSLKDALITPGLSVIAEIKRRSPSRGAIRDSDPGLQAQVYEQSCARAISVLTDMKYFGGSLDDLQKVKRKTTKPVLRKDFIIDTYQIYEARAYGADAFLLIAALLSAAQLKECYTLGKTLGMDALIEVHNENDLEKVPFDSIDIIGINNRDFRDEALVIDLKTTERLIPFIPSNKILVSESGFSTPADVSAIRGWQRINALLIGTVIMQSSRPLELIESFHALK